MKVQYFEGSQYIGERKSQVFTHGWDDGPRSVYHPCVAYFCSQCGELWGRAIVQREFDYESVIKSPWAVESRRCVRCGDGLFLTGINDFSGVDKTLLHRELQALLYQRS